MQVEFIRCFRRIEQKQKIGPFQLKTGQITQEECRIKIGAVKIRMAMARRVPQMAAWGALCATARRAA